MTTGDRLVAEVIRIAKESPDRVYGGRYCAYVLDGEPSCLVGRALWNLGLIDASIEGTERNGETIDYVADVLELDITQEQSDYLYRVQERQDNNWTWGDAIDADRVPFLEPIS